MFPLGLLAQYMFLYEAGHPDATDFTLGMSCCGDILMPKCRIK